MPSRNASLYAAATTIAIVLVVGLLCFRRPAHAPVVPSKMGVPSAGITADEENLITGGRMPSQRLDGTRWNMVAFVEPEGLRHDLSAVPFTFTFKDGNVSGRICNTMSGPYREVGDTFAASPIASTKMACSADLVMKIENAFGKALAEGLAVEWGDGEGLFHDKAGNTYVFAPAK
jgi:heat shock protein HslJ